jgi:flagellar biosynthesis regulator FlbT
MLIMPWERESPGHMFARKLTSMLNMNQNEHVTFEQHDTIMETSQVKRHMAAWKWLEDIAEEVKKL